MLQLSQGLRLNLSDSFAGDGQMPAHFFKGMVSIHANPESHPDDLFLFGGQCLQDHQYLVGYFISFRIRVW